VNQLRRRLRGLTGTKLLEALQEQLETIDVAALAADNVGRYIAANEKVSQLTGYPRSELVGMLISDLTPALRQTMAGELWSRFIQSGSQSGEFVLMGRDGTPIGVHFAAYASVAPGVHVSFLTPLELPSSI
jgi:PAS domain S-box-containing protein